MNKKFNFTILEPATGGGAKIFDNDYLDEMREELLGKIVLEGKTIDWAHLIPGVKNRVSLNEMVGVGDVTDATCGWETPGEITLAQRELIVYPKQIKDSICPKELEKTYLGMYMRTNKEVPFIGVIADQYVKTAKSYVETFIWQGDGTYYGLYQIADTEAQYTAPVNAADTMITAVNKMVAAAPAEILEREDGVLVMDIPSFVQYTQELVNANLYHYETNVTPELGFYIPGTNIKVKGVAGLNNISNPSTGKNMILTYEDNVAVGTDMLDNDEVFDIWYSRDNDEVRVNVQFKIGANFYFPDFVVKGYSI